MEVYRLRNGQIKDGKWYKLGKEATLGNEKKLVTGHKISDSGHRLGKQTQIREMDTD